MSAEFRKKFKETFFFAKNKQPVRNTIKRRNTAEVEIPTVNSILNSSNKKHNYFGYLFKQFKNKNNIILNTNNYNNNNELLLVNVDDKNNINNIVRENDFCK